MQIALQFAHYLDCSAGDELLLCPFENILSLSGERRE